MRPNMFERISAFLNGLPQPASARADTRDDPRVAAAALMYHLMDVDGVRQDVEWERMKALLGDAYSVSGSALDTLIAAGAEADADAVDLHAFTSVLNRHLDPEAKIEFVRLCWEVVLADGELHELEDHTLWRVAELIGVDRRDRVLARRQVQGRVESPAGSSSDDD